MDFQYTVIDNYKKDNHHSSYIQSMVHTAKEHMDLLVLAHFVVVEVMVELNNTEKMDLQCIPDYMYILDDA